MRTVCRFAVACSAVILASAAVSPAQAVEYLSGDKLRAAISGLTLDFLPPNGQPIRHTYTEKGTFFEYVFREEKNVHVNSAGKWWIEDDTLVCVQDNRPNREKLCRKYAIEDDILKQYTAKGALTPLPFMIVEKK